MPGRERVGLGLTVYISVRVGNHADEHCDDFEEQLAATPEVAA